MENEPQRDDWQALRIALKERCVVFGDEAWVDDAIQAAGAALLDFTRGGGQAADAIGWCMVFIRRRAVDLHRRLLREVQGVDLDALVRVAGERGGWVEKLREAGVVLSPQAEELIERIESGYRGNRRLAECLGRDVKTVREMRQRLMRRLRRLYEEVHGCPPPVERPNQ